MHAVVLSAGDALQILRFVVASVVVRVMDMMARWNRAVNALPYIPMKRPIPPAKVSSSWKLAVDFAVEFLRIVVNDSDEHAP